MRFLVCVVGVPSHQIPRPEWEKPENSGLWTKFHDQNTVFTDTATPETKKNVSNHGSFIEISLLGSFQFENKKFHVFSIKNYSFSNEITVSKLDLTQPTSPTFPVEDLFFPFCKMDRAIRTNTFFDRPEKP